jgi:phosphosulfolactate phosphohydrolase-like enzyme
VTGEDLLVAGAIVDRIPSHSDASCVFNEDAIAARCRWQKVAELAVVAGRTVSQQLDVEFRLTPGGSNLLAIDMDHDLIACAQIDTLDVVPELDIEAWRICALA